MLTLAEMLHKAIQAGASDLHLTIGTPPQLRVDGKLHPMDQPALTPADMASATCDYVANFSYSH